MDALRVSGAQLELVRDQPAPHPADGEVLIDVTHAGVCSTDLELVKGYMGFQGTLGHEFVGVVAQGPDALRGERVVGEINCVCHRCSMCRAGRETHCLDRTVLGILGRDGAFARQVTLPAENCHRVPEQLPDEHAVFVEPVAAACEILEQVPITHADRVAVIGTGRLGLVIGQVLASRQPEVQMFGRNPQTLQLARDLGLAAEPLDTERHPAGAFDIVVEATGNPAGLRAALHLTRARGYLVLKSTYAEPEPLDLAPIVINELNVVGSRCGPFPPAIDLLTRGVVQVAPLISARYPLMDGVAAMQAAAEQGNIKVLLEM